MPGHIEVVSLVRWKDESGWHEEGDIVSLPFDSETDRMDATRLIDYGVVRRRRQPRGGGK